MEENVKNLCAPIPAGLHARVREEQEVSGKTLGQYMAWLIQTFYDNQKEETTMSGDKRTVAFQVPGELFERFKDYLQEKGIKQNAFFLDCIHRAWRRPRRNVRLQGIPPTRGTWSRRAASRRKPLQRPRGKQMDVTRIRKKAVQKDKLQEGIRPDRLDPFLFWRCFRVHLPRQSEAKPPCAVAAAGRGHYRGGLSALCIGAGPDGTMLPLVGTVLYAFLAIQVEAPASWTSCGGRPASCSCSSNTMNGGRRLKHCSLSTIRKGRIKPSPQEAGKFQVIFRL